MTAKIVCFFIFVLTDTILRNSRFWTIPFSIFIFKAPLDKSITSREYAVFLRELRSVRKRNGLTQADLAERLDETQSFVSKCERGERRIDVSELRTFCCAIGLALTDFVGHYERALLAAAKQTRRKR
jgi:ribosome-binding protein aMBF1 (putative translation factor)